MKQVTPIVTRRLTLSLLICMVGLSLAQPFGAKAQTNTPEPLSPSAQEAVDKGIIAAKVPDYPLAIRYFEEARKLAPDAPVIYLNMGLAESKIPGRELRAMAWFGAYLTAYPDAPNVAAVKEQLNVLEVRNQSNTSRLIKSVQDGASQMFSGQASVVRHMEEVATLWAKSGDITAALKIADIPSDYPSFKEDVLFSIARAQAQIGDIAGAQKTASLLPGSSSLQSDIAIAQVAANDLAAAQETILLIGGEWPRRYAVQALTEALVKSGDIKTAISVADKDDFVLVDIVRVQANAGDIVGARTTADMVVSDDLKDGALSLIAIAHANSGDIGGANKFADLIKETPSSDMSRARLAILKAEAQAGDLSGALISMESEDLTTFGDVKCEGFVAIAEAQARGGDIVGAQKSLVSAQKSVDDLDDYRTSQKLKADLKELISTVQARIGSMGPGVSYDETQLPVLSGLQRAISDWISILNDGNAYNDCPLNTGPFLDLAGYLKSLPPSEDPEEVFNALQETVAKIVVAQNVISAMLKQATWK